MITTQQLAKLAGVSQSTVSRCLNNSPNISTKTKEAVQALAKQQGYVMRQKNGRKSNSKKKGIGIILSASFMENTLDPYLETLFNTIYTAIDKEGFYSILLIEHDGQNSVSQIEKIINSGSVAGFIIIITEHNHAIEQCLLHNKMPHVYTQYFSRPLQKNMNIVDLDHYTGGYMATEYLIKQGHKSIATLTNVGCDFVDRTAGYKAAMRDYALQSEGMVYKTNSNFAGGYGAMKEHFHKMTNITALFAQSDMIAIGGMAYLRDIGVSVPDELSLIGFDGVVNGEQCRPPLTTIEQPVDEIARMTLSRILRMIDEQDTKAVHSFAQPKLIVRGTVAKL